MMKNLTKMRKEWSSRVERFPKILFALSRCITVEDEGFRGPALPFANAHWRSGWSNLKGAEEGGAKTLGMMSGCNLL